MKIKIIDLFNKIYNQEDVPRKIILDNHIWEYLSEYNDYKNEDNDYLFGYYIANYDDVYDFLSKELEINNSDYNPRELINSITNLAKTRLGDKNIKFNVNIAADLPSILIGDKNHIRQVISNLVTNAIKYTNEGYINLNIKCINQKSKCLLIISVEDSGIGIKKENINKLFLKFERLDVEKNTTIEGTGLGLAITKKLVDLMHGTINVQSDFGKGSIFMVHIPQKIKVLNEIKVSDSPIIKNSDNSAEKVKGKKVLIVDDNILNIKVLEKAIKDLELIIDSVTSGAAAIKKVINEEYDLILMDIMMPQMNGEETLREMQNIGNFKTPVIAVTADAVSGAKEKYLQEGFIEYIAKPFNKREINDLIINILTKKEKINWDEVEEVVITENDEK